MTDNHREPDTLEAEHDDDWEARALCEDATCIGTLDDSGRCRVCGSQGEVPAPSTRASSATLEPLSSTAEPAALEPLSGETPVADEDEDDDDAWESRELCPDATCIGTLGPDGRCSVCERSA